MNNSHTDKEPEVDRAGGPDDTRGASAPKTPDAEPDKKTKEEEPPLYR